eukprot:CAMPEP_0113536336 /NCGR_PEP_ID=MMETSP0015_2-20120614/6194_1 /TAXON_ID=2838 /ORGANISM="Odontella" /LENGTH=372 /DNA_ID=CAMNT_0000435669 /DNA_START=72 /DNA_END=1187 /DNA_ORIENTATION=- /assembly_acc=CAM_ASM_000160
MAMAMAMAPANHLKRQKRRESSMRFGWINWLTVCMLRPVCLERLQGCLAFTSAPFRIPELLHRRHHRPVSFYATGEAEQSDGLFPVDFPFVRVTQPPSCSWVDEAAQNLKTRGVCGLLADDSDYQPFAPPIPTLVCKDAAAAASSRLDDMQGRVQNRGVDPSGAEAPYRFSEVVCRDECGGRRFDVPIPWLSGGRDDDRFSSGYAPLTFQESQSIENFQECLNNLVCPVVEAMWGKEKDGDTSRKEEESTFQVTTSGFLINEPGSEAQEWHRDGPDEGYINAFVPLVDLRESLGPTSLIPDTHLNQVHLSEYSHTIMPLLKLGEVLLFDYRTLHRGQGNTSKSSSRPLGYAVFSRNHGASSRGDVHNFPAST